MAVALAVKKWTLAELHRLPEDGNKYELVRGELFVTPPPSDWHETIAARLSEILAPYVRAESLGIVFRPKAVMRFDKSEVEPDLFVRQPHPNRQNNDSDWTTAPIPILVVEILSPYTRRRDFNEKKRLYLEADVEEYWIVDPELRSIAVMTRQAMQEETDTVTWSPSGSAAPLTFSVSEIF